MSDTFRGCKEGRKLFLEMERCYRLWAQADLLNGSDLDGNQFREKTEYEYNKAKFRFEEHVENCDRCE